METINNIELKNPDIYPSDDVLMLILDNSFLAYKELLNLFVKHGLKIEWRYYNDGKTWLCKVQHKKKTIVWMSAFKGFMQATIYFPEKFINEIINLNISNQTILNIKSRKNIGKSIPCIFEVKNSPIIKDLEEVMKYKIQCK